MSLGNTNAQYGAVTKAFHWLTALLILTVIPLGIIANGLAHEIRNPDIANTDADIARAALMFSLHKTTGVIIFFVALARIGWAVTQPKPGLLHPERKAEAFAAETVHWLLYGSLVLVPLTGWIHHAATTGFAPIWWPFGQSLPFVPKDNNVAHLFAGLHQVLERVLLVAVVLHIAGALKHHFIDRDATLVRMWPGRTEAAVPPAEAKTSLPAVAALAVWAGALAIATGLGIFTARTDAPATAPKLAQVQSDWQVTGGTLGINITQLGNRVSGSFADWTAAITFDEPDAPGPAGHVNVTVAISSLELGSVSDQAMGPDFFDAKVFPTATFSGDITRTETGYVATGPLTIRDVTMPVDLPFSLDITADGAVMTGTLSLHRLDFGVGSSMPDESSLGFAVDVTIDLTAIRVGTTN